jgi:iron(III) transport system ATP-binding protein
VTTIMVTHDQEEALAMADRIVVMNAGQVEQVGGPAEVYRRPQTPFVARFVGQMNFLSAIASGRSGWARVGAVELRHQTGFEAASGSAVTLAIRPEEIAVGPSASGAVNSLTARIAGLQFLGPFTRLALSVEGNGQAALECDVAATAFAALGVGEGALIPIALDPEALRAFRPVGTAG